MKNFLLLAFCFFAVQINSCSVGNIEIQAEATKFTIQNNSIVPLQDVIWNGVSFGAIYAGVLETREIPSDGQSSYVFFKASNGQQYKTVVSFPSTKYRHKKITLIDATPVINDNSTAMSRLGDILK